VPTELTFDRHLEGLRSAMVALVRYADRAGPDAAVPTCPGWTVLDLVAHQGMVHRWATGLVRGEWQLDTDVEAFSRDGRDAEDPLEWLRDGVVELVSTLTRAPADLEAPVFLHDAPSPRAFWARRQCHETTMHAVDALAAALGRPPAAAETWIGPELAADGVDELLGGFVPRARSQVRCEEEGLLVVSPSDAPDWWAVRIGPGPAVTTRRRGPRTDGDWVLDGPVVELYLRLWNRGTADPGADRWRDLAAVAWA
jgi:uncharacterized protein (TIGR03083 family)